MRIKYYNSLPNNFVENHVLQTNLQDKLFLQDLFQLGAVSLQSSCSSCTVSSIYDNILCGQLQRTNSRQTMFMEQTNARVF